MPLIALTGDLGEQAEVRAHGQGVDFLLHKPVDGRALVDAIRWVTHKAVH
jgi:DNA-binding response OmpR family regulator